MEKTTKNERPITGRQSQLRPDKKTVTPKGQRAEHKKTPSQNLKESELRYRRLFEAAQDGILILDARTGAIEDVNPYLIDLLGYSRPEFEKKKLWEVGAFRDVDASRIAFNVLQENGYIRYKNLPLRAKDGQLIQVEFVSNVYQAGDRQIIQCNIRVMSDRTWVYDAVRASEARYRGLFEDSPISLWEEDFSAVKQRLEALRKDGITDFQEYFTLHPEKVAELTGLIKVLDVNKATMIMFGAAQKDDLIKNPAVLFNVEQNQEFQNELINIAEGKTGFRWEGSNRTLDGRLIDIDLNWSAAPGFENTMSRVIVSMIDITERRKTERTLHEKEEQYRLFIDTAVEGIWVVDKDWKTSYVNPAMAEMLGYTEAELIGQRPLDFVASEGVSKAREFTERREAGVSERIVLPMKRKDGSLMWAYSNSVPLLDDKGAFVGGLSMVTDITERKQSEERIGRQLRQLAALREIDRVIASSFDLDYNLTWILGYLTKELGVDAADVLILNPVSSRLDYGGAAGFRTTDAEKAIKRTGQKHAMRAVMDRQLVYFPNLKDEPNDLLTAKVLADEDFACYYGVPLMAKGSVKGVLEIYQRASLEPHQDWLDFINSMAGQAALAIDNASLFETLQRSNIDLTLAYDATIEGWSRAMDLRDRETEGHTQRVTALALDLASLFGVKDDELAGVRRGALLHDIGKMGVPDGVLLKPGPLTDEEWILMKKHPALAFEMLAPIHYLQSAMDIPYCHHEKWDGTGYPRGLKGEQIPLIARIFSVVDVWDALTSDRPYRKAWPNEKVLEYLKSEAGKHFDPAVLKICLESGVFERKDYE